MCNQRAPSRDKKFSQMGGDVVVPWSAPVPGPLSEGETDTMSNAQRSTLKWEKEETLGEMATVAPVLYTNVNFPNLLGEFPGWYRMFGSLKFLCELLKIMSSKLSHSFKRLYGYCENETRKGTLLGLIACVS